MNSAHLQVAVIRPHDGVTYRMPAGFVTIKAGGATTNGTYSLFEICTDPDEGPCAYRQRYEDEAFWVLEGTYTFFLDTQGLVLGPGSYVYVPRGTIHRYTNTGLAPGRMLLVVTPGGIRERFVATAGQRVVRPGSVAREAPPRCWTTLRTIAWQYGIDIIHADPPPHGSD